MKQTNVMKRWLWFVCGLCINSFGIVCITKGALGTSVISSVPYVLSLRFPSMSFGMTTFIINMLFILVEMILLKKDFHPIQFLQIAANFLFSAFLDLFMAVLSFLSPASLVLQILLVIAGSMILAFGICVEVAPDVITVPGEGIVKAIAIASKKEFGSVKICFDLSMIAIASVLSLAFFHGLHGVGIGTVITAFLTGPCVSWIKGHLSLIQKIQKLSD